MTIVKEIISSNYDNVFEFIQRKSAWKVKGSTFVKRADCLEDIKIIIKNMMPELEKLFSEKGLVFSDFLIGKYGMVEYDAWPYRRSVWTAKVLRQIIGKPPIKKIFDEILPDQTIYITDRYGEIKRATATKLYYYDPYLSEYILKYTEMMFREYFGYEYLAWPEALIGALKMRIGGCVEYILSTNKEYQKKQKKYISLYPNITKIIRFSVKDYMDKNEKRMNTLKKVFEEVSKIISLFLTFVINKFAPFAIFCLLTRTFAIYGIDSLKPALAYVVTVIIALFVYLFVAYPIYLMTMARVNPKPFMKKAAKVALFGFSTSSSAASLPLNRKTTVEELGVHDQIASFVLPLGMTVNMDGTAIMQVIAAMFVAVSSGYKVTFMSIAIIAILALIASIGTPAAPGAEIGRASCRERV